MYINIDNSVFITTISGWIADKPVIALDAGTASSLTFGPGGAAILALIMFFTLVKVAADLACKFIEYGMKLIAKPVSDSYKSNAANRDGRSLMSTIIFIMVVFLALLAIIRWNS